MKRSSMAAVFLSAACVMGSCGGGASSPAQPAPTVAPPTLPAPTPGTGAGGGGSCPLGKGNPEADCLAGSPRLQPAVEAAIDALVQKRPELFNTSEENGAGTRQYRVLDGSAYLDGVIANLQSAGLCAERTIDGERVALKDVNAYSEEWDLITAKGFIRRGVHAYQTTCTPASFPLEPADIVAFVRTGLWAYECNPPVATPPVTEAKLPLGCAGHVTATPKDRKNHPLPAAIHGPDVHWELREGADIVTLEPDWRWPENPYNKMLVPRGRLGMFLVCATLFDKEGCVRGQTIP
ncbi:MAG TPA: hypothetical protein VEQ10_03560 [Vicinamibacteria bacterium]|nr:hypothetical protein [Vicinamibacteria bacterium]